MHLFLLQHVRPALDVDNGEDVKTLGIFSSREAAQQALDALRAQPGFSLFPDGFHISPYELDAIHWSDGFDLIDQRTWTVWRQDETGNRYLVSSGHTRGEAFQIVRDLEVKGHKQTYWADPDAE